MIKKYMEFCSLYISCMNNCKQNDVCFTKLYKDSLKKLLNLSTANTLQSVYIDTKPSTSVLALLEILYLIKQQKLTKNCEITLAITPTCQISTSMFDLKRLQKCGVSRICLRPVHLSPQFLNCSFPVTDCVEGVCAVFDNIGVDFIYEPSLSLGYESFIFKLVDIGVKHSTLHEHSPKNDILNTNEMPEKYSYEDVEFKAFESLQHAFLQCDFSHYELCNFALNGYKCVQNMNLWKAQQYIGIGPGAHSRISVCKSKPFHQTALTCFYKQSNFHFKSTKLSKVEVLEELLFLGLRTAEGVNNYTWQQASYGTSLYETFKDDEEVKDLLQHNILTMDEIALKMNMNKILLLDAVLLVMLKALYQKYSQSFIS